MYQVVTSKNIIKIHVLQFTTRYVRIYVIDKMKRVLNENAIAKAKWEYYVPQILKQAKMEKGVHVEKKFRKSPM